MYLNLKKGIKFYNDNRPHRTVKMSQEYLGELTLPDKQKATQITYMTHWGNGKMLRTLTVGRLKKICEVLGVTPNYLISEQVELGNSIDDILVIDLMKVSNGQSKNPNEMLGFSRMAGE